jgi:hypothetical protein
VVSTVGNDARKVSKRLFICHGFNRFFLSLNFELPTHEYMAAVEWDYLSLRGFVVKWRLFLFGFHCKINQATISLTARHEGFLNTSLIIYILYHGLSGDRDLTVATGNGGVDQNTRIPVRPWASFNIAHRYSLQQVAKPV